LQIPAGGRIGEMAAFDPQKSSIELDALLKARGDAYSKLGQFREAEQCYRLALKSGPPTPGILVNLGFVLKELGRLAESAEFIDRALLVAQDNADAHFIRGALHQADSNSQLAMHHFERAVTVRPDFEFAYRELIVALFQAGRVQEAAHWCERALENIPNSGELHFYRSNLHKQANATEAAIASARISLTFRPTLSVARASLGELLLRAEREARRPEEIAAGYADLGVAFKASAEFVPARVNFEKAAAMAPHIADHQYNLGTVLRYQGDVSAAAACFDKAITLDPNDPRPRWAKSLVHAKPFPASSAEASHARTHIIAALEDFARWSSDRDLQGGEFVGTNSPFYLSYKELDNRPVFERYAALCAKARGNAIGGKGAAVAPATQVNSARLRIGIVSADIRDHSVWFALIKGWLEHLDRAQFEIAVFSLGHTVDLETEWARQHADLFVQGPKSLSDWVLSISSFAPAVLVYPAIGLDVTTLQLASLRLAKTQMTTWGHPETSGLPTIDVFLSGDSFEPTNGQQFYTESLVPLPGLGNCYKGRVQQILEPDLAALGIDAARPILICSGTAFKYQAEHDHVLTTIAKEIEGAQLLFFRQRPENLSDLLKLRLERAFHQERLDFHRCVRFLPAQPLAAFHGLLSRADVALDTIGFSGYNTAIQAIEAGLPVITREGQFLRGRLASGILRQLGMTELIAQTTADYVRLCGTLINDSQWRGRIRSDLAQRRPVLYDDVAPILHLQKVLSDRARC